jgi:hypothetical protein
MADGAPITFYVNGMPAEVSDVGQGVPWQSVYPFRAGAETNLSIRPVPLVPRPDEVAINALGMTISNDTCGFFSTLKLEKDPWMEARVTKDMFTIQISATGVHEFHDRPVLGKDATLGIYESGVPVSPERNVWFGSKKVIYEYFATETRTFDILIYVNEDPSYYDVKHITIFAVSDPENRGNFTRTEPAGGYPPGNDDDMDGS